MAFLSVPQFSSISRYFLFIWKHVEIAICFQGQPAPQWQIYRLLKTTILGFTKHCVWERKMEAHKELKISKFYFLWLFSAEAGTAWLWIWGFPEPGGAWAPSQMLECFLKMAQQDLSQHCSVLTPQPLTSTPQNTVFATVLLGQCIPSVVCCWWSWERWWWLDIFHAVVPHAGSDSKARVTLTWLIAWWLKVGVMWVATEEPSTLFPCWQDGLTPDCSSADSVFRPSSSAIFLSTGRQETALWEEPAEPPRRAVAICEHGAPWTERGIPSLIWCPFGEKVNGENDHFQFCDFLGHFKRKRLIKIACSNS